MLQHACLARRIHQEPASRQAVVQGAPLGGNGAEMTVAQQILAAAYARGRSTKTYVARPRRSTAAPWALARRTFSRVAACARASATEQNARARARGARVLYGRALHTTGTRTGPLTAPFTYSYWAGPVQSSYYIVVDESTERNGTRYGINVERFELARTHASLQLSAYRTVSASAVGCVTLTVPTDGPSHRLRGLVLYIRRISGTHTHNARAPQHPRTFNATHNHTTDEKEISALR